MAHLAGDPTTPLSLPLPALVTAPDGVRWRVEIVPPGEPVARAGGFAVLVWLAVLMSRGHWIPKADNSRYVVVAARQRGSWRGFEQVMLEEFDDPNAAADRHRAACEAVIEGCLPTL